MSRGLFFRLLKTPIDCKGEVLAARIAELNTAAETDDTFVLDPAEFVLVPGAPFAYWVGDTIRQMFEKLPPLQSEGRRVCFGLSTKDDFQFLRLFWEVGTTSLGSRWYCFAKGGAYSPYYCDVHLVLDWENNGERLKAFANRRTRELFGISSWSRWINNWTYYFRPGLTWPRRTQKGFNLRVLPRGCIFGDKGPTIFVDDDDAGQLLRLLGQLNSATFRALLETQMAFGSYELGVVQRTPVPTASVEEFAIFAQVRGSALAAYRLQRWSDEVDETSHMFGLPTFVSLRCSASLHDASGIELRKAQDNAVRLENIQERIDSAVSTLYGVPNRAETSLDAADARPVVASGERYESSLRFHTEDLLMWCVGVAFGRWDVRKALDPSLLLPLGEPFDPLPRCAPGALMGEDGLPLSREHLLADYPLPIAWHGILVDDPTHPSDIVNRVRAVLRLLWENRANEIEAEACEILSVETLRDYFRDPRRFFAFHIKRYSKSRRRAPIYWLLQSEHRTYGIWLYYHRLNASTLYTAGRDYADVKVNLEQDHLTRRQEGLASLEGADLRRRQRQIAHQERVVSEVAAFRNALDKIALQDLAPDLNDGVVISIAPLHELVPWTYAQRTWDELVRGDHDWSTMARQMRAKGLVRSTEK